MTFPKVSISAADRIGKYKSYSFCAIYGIKLMEALSDDVLLKATDWDSEESKAICRRIGSQTNPYWVIAQAAEALYERGLIDEHKLDELTR